MHHSTDSISHTTAFVTPVVEHWLDRTIAQWVHHELVITSESNEYHLALQRGLTVTVVNRVLLEIRRRRVPVLHRHNNPINRYTTRVRQLGTNRAIVLIIAIFEHVILSLLLLLLLVLLLLLLSRCYCHFGVIIVFHSIDL